MCGEKLENYNYDNHDPDHGGHIDHDHSGYCDNYQGDNHKHNQDENQDEKYVDHNLNKMIIN